MHIGIYRNLNHARKGFTLLEMMLVVMIMGVLLGVAAWNIIGTSNKARRATTVATMKQVSGMLYQMVSHGTGGASAAAAEDVIDFWTEEMATNARP